MAITGRLRYSIGIILLLGVVVLWVGSNFLVAEIYDGDVKRPFFITYFNTGTFSLYLIVPLVQFLFERLKPALKSADTEAAAFSDEKGKHIEDTTSKSSVDKKDSPLTIRETAKLSFIFCLLWFFANWTNNASYQYISGAIGTILSSTSGKLGIFTLIFSVIFKVEKLTYWKVAGLIITLGGASMVAASSPSSSSIAGVFLALGSAFFYGAYTTLLKFKVGDESRMDMQLFLGFVGLINIILLLPLFFVLHYTGEELFSLPDSSQIWGMLLINAFIGAFLSDLMWVYAVVMTSPLVVTIGLSLTTPFAMIGDIIFKHAEITPLYGCGAGLVVIGFLVVNREAFDRKNFQQNN